MIGVVLMALIKCSSSSISAASEIAYGSKEYGSNGFEDPDKLNEEVWILCVIFV